MINHDLENRTFQFAKNVIMLCKTMQNDKMSAPLISQLIRSATSIGANYREANGSSSKNDFRNKIHICKKEAKETKYWLELISETTGVDNKKIQVLTDEVQQLILIFGKITSTLSKN